MLGARADGNARQGVRRPAPRDRLFAQRNTRDSPTIRRSTLSSGDLSVGTSNSWQRSRPAWGAAEAGRCRRDCCQNQWRVVLVICCNRPRHQVDFGCRSVRTTWYRSSCCVSTWALRETRPLRGRISRRWLRLSDCPCSIRIERSAWLYWPKPDRKMVSDTQNEDRPLP